MLCPYEGGDQTYEQTSRGVCGLTRGGVPYKQGDKVGDGRLAFGEVVEAAGIELLSLLSRWQLVQSQVVLLFKQLPRTRSEP